MFSSILHFNSFKTHGLFQILNQLLQLLLILRFFIRAKKQVTKPTWKVELQSFWHLNLIKPNTRYSKIVDSNIIPHSSSNILLVRLTNQQQSDVSTATEFWCDIENLLVTSALLDFEDGRFVFERVGLVSNLQLDGFWSVFKINILHVSRVKDFEMELLNDGHTSQIFCRNLIIILLA